MTTHNLFLKVAAAATLAVLATAGCARQTRRDVAPDKPPQVRVLGARIMEPDEQRASAPETVPAIQTPAPPATPTRSAVPKDVAAGINVSLDLIDARASDVLRGLAYQGNVDLILSGLAERRLTVRLQNAPWLEAFEAVLTGAGLVAEWDGRRVRVTTPDQLRTERETTERLERARPVTEVLLLQNLLAKDAAAALSSILSEAGRIGTDEERNALVVTDAPSRIETIRAALKDLDRAAPQVMIEAVIVDVTHTDDLHYGVDWTIANSGGKAATIRQALRVGAGINPVASPGGSLAFTILHDEWNINGIFDALQSMDNVKILASPKILAVNNCQARIEIIEEIPYQVLTQTSEGGQIGTTSFKEVGVKLDVTPRIAADGAVHLVVTAEQSNPTGAAVNQIPVIQTRRSNSTMTVRHGEIVVLGGLRRHRTTTNEDKIPILGDIPWLGAAFRRVETVDADSELVLFIRPTIVPPGSRLTKREKVMAEAIDNVERRPQMIRTDPLRQNIAEEDERLRRVP